MKRILFFLMMAVIGQSIEAQNVGIGTTTPDASAILDIKSNTKGMLIPRTSTTSRLAIVNPPKGLMVYDTTVNSFWYYNSSVWNQLGTGGASPWTVSGTTIYNSNTGNVGIGTSTPTSKLHVVGNSLVENGNITIDDDFGTLYFKSASSNKGYVQLRSTNDFKMGTIGISNTTGSLIFETQSIARITVVPDGNVGIGLNSALERLDVNGNIRSRNNLIADNNITAAGTIVATGTVQGGALVTGGNLVVAGTGVVSGDLQTNSDLIINDAVGTLHLQNSNVDKGFVQLSGDDLRIGTYSANSTGRLVIRTGGNDVMNVRSSGLVSIGVNVNGAAALNPNAILQVTNSNDKVQIDNTGKLGIGFISSEPILSRLHILNGSDVSLNSHGYLMLGAVTGTNLIFDNNEIMARNNGATASLVLQNDGGSVRIGNAAVPSGYKFAIDGKMICEELKVQLQGSWPDYVFSENHKLPSLNEVEKFIEQNKHLPNIPSAAEVEKNGIEVGDMQKRMMEKIEELTLYIIELKKQVDEFKKTVNK